MRKKRHYNNREQTLKAKRTKNYGTGKINAKKTYKIK